MDRARELAERGRYTVAPNPMVGAVVFRNGEIIGEGWHARAGGDHAEVAAIKDSGPGSSGASMYVTLEPCNHHGRTPPCTDAILRAGISRVVVGQVDPDPRMRGRSIELLREAGVEVEVREDPSLRKQNEQFFHYVIAGRPFVHLKLASTLDGRIAAANGDSKWVTGEKARLRARELRAEAGAVLVGAGTLRTDDPLLTAHGLPGAPPVITRVVLDPNLTMSADRRLAQTAGATPVVVFTGQGPSESRVESLERLGVEVVPAPIAGEGLDLGYVLDELGKREVRGVLVEGGGVTAGLFVSEGLVDKLTLFYAPKMIGAEGVPMVGKLHLPSMSDASRFAVSNVELVGEDVAMTLYPTETHEEDCVYRAG